MRKAFILIASGPFAEMSGNHFFPCKTAYTSRARAEAEAPAFKDRCTKPRDERDFRYLDPDLTKVSVLELDLDVAD